MHSIEIFPEQHMLLVNFYGDVHFDERGEALNEVAAAVRSSGFSRVLIDFCTAQLAADGLSAANRFADRLAREPALVNCRIAYVRRPTQHDPAVEVLALGKGFEPEWFYARDQALAWLQG